jgi:hypothetical protein
LLGSFALLGLVGIRRVRLLRTDADRFRAFILTADLRAQEAKVFNNQKRP